jgi:Flp pilus assembly protein TadG
MPSGYSPLRWRCTVKRQLALNKLYAQRQRRRERTRPRGIVVVVTAFCLCALFAFVALSVDASRMVLTGTRMQNAVDAAALAAAEEITAAVYTASGSGGSPTIDANSAAIAAARQMAANVAQKNGVYVDPNADVYFGKRAFNSTNGTWPIQWGATPYNVVKVVARRTNTNTAAADGQLPLAFGWAVGRSKVPLETHATAFVEARDIVVVLDVSASMNDDSSLDSTLSATEVDKLLDGIWDSLRTADPKWPSTTKSKFLSTGFGSINSYAGTYVSSTTTSTVLNSLGLNQSDTSGNRKYPFPQAGRNSDGSPKGKPSNTTSDALWSDYIDYVKGLSGTYNRKYGYRTLMSFMEQQRYDPSQSEDLWRTPHYPFAAIKGGASLFLDFLNNLDFGDEVGWVAYGQWAVQQKTYYDGEVNVDISSNPITPDYTTVNTMITRHQAGELNGWTAMGDGVKKGRELLVGTGGSDVGYTRVGAQPTMLVMTDGMTNQKPSGWTLPSSFHWSDWTDYDGNGTADYTTTDSYKKYAFWEATEAIKKGIVIHTLAVGNDADRNLMKAIAFASGGVYINVPGDGVEYMRAGLLDAFAQIAGKVPPPKLVYDQ